MKARLFHLYALCGLSLVLASYGAGKTMVIYAGEQRKINSIAVIEGPSVVPVPAEASAAFKKHLDELLFSKDGFKRGDDLTLTYRFVQFDEGNRFERWASQGLAGEGSLTIEVGYTDKSGKKLGEIISKVKIGSLLNSRVWGLFFLADPRT
ncbi:MAG: DUF4410 domain-containing protein, partial [Steroidobacteraceae bacterium]